MHWVGLHRGVELRSKLSFPESEREQVDLFISSKQSCQFDLFAREQRKLKGLLNDKIWMGARRCQMGLTGTVFLTADGAGLAAR